jgi:hypothetical protein
MVAIDDIDHYYSIRYGHWTIVYVLRHRRWIYDDGSIDVLDRFEISAKKVVVVCVDLIISQLIVGESQMGIASRNY